MHEERLIRVTNTLGLHARAAAQLVRLANGFACTITLKRPDSSITANAKSILSVLNLAASCGVTLQVTADGDDHSQALDAIEALFESNFGEGA